MTLPNHVAIIMDGNGRWAKARHHNRVFGHVRGARVAKRVIEACSRLQIAHLTLFAFSTENWFRPATEVNVLMRLLHRQLQREQDSLMRQNIRFRTIGDLARLPHMVRQVVEQTIEMTAANTGLQLTFALSYGGRQELVATLRHAVELVEAGELRADEIDESRLRALMPSTFLPDPDLIIRTSGERRLSNFFLWQAAYSEVEFEPKSWPDFTEEDLFRILTAYAQRERRFGRISEQIVNTV